MSRGILEELVDLANSIVRLHEREIARLDAELAEIRDAIIELDHGKASVVRVNELAAPGFSRRVARIGARHHGEDDAV
jgi:hypothetical protein